MSSPYVLRVPNGSGSLGLAPLWVPFSAATTYDVIGSARGGTGGAAAVGAAADSSISISSVPSRELWAGGEKMVDAEAPTTDSVATATVADWAGGMVTVWAALGNLGEGDKVQLPVLSPCRNHMPLRATASCIGILSRGKRDERLSRL